MTGRNTIAAAESRGEIGGVLIARYPGRVLYAVAFQQIASRQFEAAVTQLVKYRAAIGLAELAAQAARAHSRLCR